MAPFLKCIWLMSESNQMPHDHLRHWAGNFLFTTCCCGLWATVVSVTQNTFGPSWLLSWAGPSARLHLGQFLPHQCARSSLSQMQTSAVCCCLSGVSGRPAPSELLANLASHDRELENLLLRTESCPAQEEAAHRACEHKNSPTPTTTFRLDEIQRSLRHAWRTDVLSQAATTNTGNPESLLLHVCY